MSGITGNRKWKVDACYMWCGYDKSFSTIVQDIQYTNKLVYLGFFIGEFFQKLVACMCSNIPASPAYGVYISQLIRYARASSNYSDFLKRHLHLRNRLLDQGYKKICLIRSLKKFIFRYQDLVEIYSVSAEKIINDGFSYSENV